MVTKEPSVYYRLKGKYRFRNLITGRDAFVGGNSNPTMHKCRGKELEILREQAIDRALNMLSVYLRPNNREEWKLQWVLVEILNEEWQKL